ncbi:hypothetical protein [Paenibacillus sp. FSL H3-0333]|uniref:hypothetical protein n=1 Tax=Paenibacillus sp. FSL H3-0333 TaxID=2921373 RepID=UPI0030FBE0B4
MEDKVDIIGKLIEEVYGLDYFDRYFRSADVYAYTFENDKKERFVWQCKVRCNIKLTEGCLYHLRALKGRRLLGGRGVSITDVEILGEMKVTDNLIRLT